MHPYMLPALMAHARASKHMDMKKATAIDEKIISNLPKDVRKALNVICPKSLRISIRAITQYANELRDKEEALYKKNNENERKLNDMKDKVLHAAAKPYVYSHSNQAPRSDGQRLAHSYIVNSKEKGPLPENVAPRIKAYFKARINGKKKTKKEHKEVKTIDALMRKALNRLDDVFWTLDGWYVDKIHQKTVDLSLNKEYMKLVNEQTEISAERKKIQEEEREFRESCYMGMSFSGFGF